MKKDFVRSWALGVLTVIHVLGILGTPIAIEKHLFQAGATPHQNFHVIWEGCKYATASLFAVALIQGPLRRGEGWARVVLAVGSIVMFGGVFVSHAFTGGGPAIDFWSYGPFLVLSLAALAALAEGPRPPAA